MHNLNTASDALVLSPHPPAPKWRSVSAAPLLSVVVPVRNEGPSILPLIEEIREALANSVLRGQGYEIVFVDDGSQDETPTRLTEAAAPAGPPASPVRWLRHAHGFGQSAALRTGITAATGEWIVTLDGDGQNDPADIPPLLARALATERSGSIPLLVAGQRTRRRDPWPKRVTSRLANTVRARLLGDGIGDTGCGLKVFRREAFLALPHFDHMHRFLPALFLRAGGRIEPVPVNHRLRLRGRSNYGTLDRLGIGLADIGGMLWLQRRALRPQVSARSDVDAP